VLSKLSCWSQLLAPTLCFPLFLRFQSRVGFLCTVAFSLSKRKSSVKIRMRSSMYAGSSSWSPSSFRLGRCPCSTLPPTFYRVLDDCIPRFNLVRGRPVFLFPTPFLKYGRNSILRRIVVWSCAQLNFFFLYHFLAGNGRRPPISLPMFRFLLFSDINHCLTPRFPWSDLSPTDLFYVIVVAIAISLFSY